MKKVGRPKIGTSRSLKITLPDDAWALIDDLIAKGIVKNATEVFRESFYNSQSYFDMVADTKQAVLKDDGNQLYVWAPHSAIADRRGRAPEGRVPAIGNRSGVQGD